MTPDDDSYENSLLAQQLGTVQAVRKKLVDGPLTKVLGRLDGKEKIGVRFPRMPLVSDDILRLHVFANFEATDEDLADIYLKFHESGDIDDLENKWDPEEFSRLSYVDWSIAPPMPTPVANSEKVTMIGKKKPQVQTPVAKTPKNSSKSSKNKKPKKAAKTQPQTPIGHFFDKKAGPGLTTDDAICVDD